MVHEQKRAGLGGRFLEKGEGKGISVRQYIGVLSALKYGCTELLTYRRWKTFTTRLR